MTSLGAGASFAPTGMTRPCPTPIVKVAAIWLGLVGFCSAQTPPLFNVKDYGAVGDGAAIDTPAINNAIIAANAAGGGTVVFPAGNYLSVSIHLSNNVTLYLS